MPTLPLYIPAVFIITTLLTLFFLRKAVQNSTIVTGSVIWIGVQGIIALTGFYLVTDTVPPRFLLAIGIPILIVLYLTFSKTVNSWSLRWLTMLHVVRIPVELVLYWLYVHRQVPELMTFEGSNFDILSGITAPIIFWIGFTNKQPRKWLLLTWNIICLLLLFNIVIHAILSAPVPFQQFAFDQPNVAVLYWPYVWLPAFIVPVVLLAHLVAIKKLLGFNHKTGLR